MPYPTPTTGLGVAAQIVVPGNTTTSIVPGKAAVHLSISGTNGPTTFQLEPQVQDAAGNSITPGVALVLTAVAASSPGALVLTAVDALGNYTGTITGGAANALVGNLYTIAGFVNGANNVTAQVTASTATVLSFGTVTIAETHAGTATNSEGTAVYTGTITGGGSNALAGQTFVVLGFAGSTNNGTYAAVASSATTLTLENNFAVAETHAATAASQETGGNVLVYSQDGSASYTGSTSPISGTIAKVVNVSATGLLTLNGVKGHCIVEVAYPAFNNAAGTQPVAGVNQPVAKIYASVKVRVLA